MFRFQSVFCNHPRAPSQKGKQTDRKRRENDKKVQPIIKKKERTTKVYLFLNPTKHEIIGKKVI